jgi:fatty-acyl-CoA synthase
VIRERFSARRFWADVVENGCTIFLYIGELCRYLLNAPEDANDRRHSLRLCVGNGLRADVWQAFQNRFRIQSILEFYASTEGNVSLYNCEGRPGAIGRIPAFLAHRFPVALIQCHVETGEPLRDADNRCILCEPGCVGEAIGQISTQGGRGTARFEGYTDAAATERKIIRDVFAEGDAWFRTGDLMRRDAAGFFYFVDRMGDTFRWKGENVSTTEVGEVLARYPGVAEAIVYGVPVEAEEGRACMAALSTTADFDLQGLPDFLAQCLPPYARPIFLRLCSSIEATGTFKPIKTRLMHEAFDPRRSEDPLFQFCRDRGMFVEMVRDRLEVLV